MQNHFQAKALSFSHLINKPRLWAYVKMINGIIMQKTTTLDVNIAQIPLKQFHYAQILEIEGTNPRPLHWQQPGSWYLKPLKLLAHQMSDQPALPGSLIESDLWIGPKFSVLSPHMFQSCSPSNIRNSSVQIEGVSCHSPNGQSRYLGLGQVWCANSVFGFWIWGVWEVQDWHFTIFDNSTDTVYINSQVRYELLFKSIMNWQPNCWLLSTRLTLTLYVFAVGALGVSDSCPEWSMSAAHL